MSLPVPFGLFFLRILLDLQILNENSMISLAHVTAQVNKLIRDVWWCFEGKSLMLSILKVINVRSVSS